MVFGIFDEKRPTKRDKYDSYEDEYQSKMIGGPTGKPIGEGFNFTIDGKSLSYRDPRNFNATSTAAAKAGGGSMLGNEDHNRHSYNMTNSLYKYSYGDIENAGKALGIANVNKKKEVDKIHEYLERPRTAAVEPTKPDKPKKDKDAKLGAPTEPVKTVLSKPAAEANAFVEAHNAMTMGNQNPLAGIAASNQAGVSSPEAGAFKQNFQLNLGSSDSTPLTFTEAVTGTKPSIAGGFMANYKDAIKKNLEPM